MEQYIHDRTRNWNSPFIDLFFFKIAPDNERNWINWIHLSYNLLFYKKSVPVQTTSNRTVMLREITPAGKAHKFNSFDVQDYFPTQPFYFAGLTVMGPLPTLARKRYRWNACRMGAWNHRIETTLKHLGKYDLDCARLSQVFPFAYNDGVMRTISGNTSTAVSLFPPKATAKNHSILSEISIEDRSTWASFPEPFGTNLTRLIPHLNTVEVDNSISTANEHECTENRHNITVVEFNAERGTRWLEAVEFLKGADVIILNEMDIGMARTDQQHTTRLMAHLLHMNYAWGLEFVELTNGDKEEQHKYGGLPNFHGLHGNAILTRCPISDPVILRDSVGQYFSDRKISLNAHGYEKRLGGRMGMFVSIRVNGERIVVGSTHKLAGHAEQVKRYIASSKAITAGDQDRSFCGRVGLQSVDDARHATWPASCSKLGSGRGDNICSNLGIAQPEQSFKPCIERFGISAKLSDHAFTKVTLVL
jgi:hypothetical protein